jgi:hypothetical protein
VKEMIKIYYGLSGTLKSTTIKQKYGYFGERCENTAIIRSAIKNWKYNRDALFPWLCNESNLNYALLHLTRLQDYVYGDYDFIIERGVTDPLYYEYQIQPELITPYIISSAVNRESEILQPSMIKKTLMIMLDKDFIRNKTLSEKTRADWFQGVEDYLEKQEDYVKFTKKYNDITEIIEIKDAREYLESLGIEYNV